MSQFILGIVVLGLAAGCTFSAVTPQTVTGPPAPAPATLVLGEIAVADPSWEGATVVFRRGMAEWLGRNGGFRSVLIEPAADTPPDCVVLRGRITEVDRGNAALRLLIGMGAGQAPVKGAFEITRPDGSIRPAGRGCLAPRGYTRAQRMDPVAPGLDRSVSVVYAPPRCAFPERSR